MWHCNDTNSLNYLDLEEQKSDTYLHVNIFSGLFNFIENGLFIKLRKSELYWYLEKFLLRNSDTIYYMTLLWSHRVLLCSRMRGFTIMLSRTSLILGLLEVFTFIFPLNGLQKHPWRHKLKHFKRYPKTFTFGLGDQYWKSVPD